MNMYYYEYCIIISSGHFRRDTKSEDEYSCIDCLNCYTVYSTVLFLQDTSEETLNLTMNTVV